MTDSLGTLLTTLLQQKGICSDNYDKISTIIYESLDEIDSQILEGEYLVFPRGTSFTKGKDIKRIKDANQILHPFNFPQRN